MSIDQHLRMQRILWLAFFVSLAGYAALALALPAPAEAITDRHAPLLWALGLVAAVNLLTVMPVFKLMLARTERIGSEDGAVDPLLRAQKAAFVVAIARVEAVGVLGLVLFLVSSRLDWFALFAGAAGVGMLTLFPRRSQIESLLQTPSPLPPPIDPT